MGTKPQQSVSPPEPGGHSHSCSAPTLLLRKRVDAWTPTSRNKRQQYHAQSCSGGNSPGEKRGHRPTDGVMFYKCFLLEHPGPKYFCVPH